MAQIQGLHSILVDPYFAREGVIIKWPLNVLFNNARDVILST